MLRGDFDVTGTAVLSTRQVTRATFRVSLDAITVNGKAHQPVVIQSLEVAAHPVATVPLSDPVALPAEFSSGDNRRG